MESAPLFGQIHRLFMDKIAVQIENRVRRRKAVKENTTTTVRPWQPPLPVVVPTASPWCPLVVLVSCFPNAAFFWCFTPLVCPWIITLGPIGLFCKLSLLGLA